MYMFFLRHDIELEHIVHDDIKLSHGDCNIHGKSYLFAFTLVLRQIVAKWLKNYDNVRMLQGPNDLKWYQISPQRFN